MQLSSLSVPTYLNNKAAFGLSVVVAYVIACKALRFRTVRGLEKKYGDARVQKDGKPMVGRPDVKLTPREMQDIMFATTEYDMPGLMIYALTFALFKTYAIVSISCLFI